MNALIHREGCIGCTLCARICPDVFSMTDVGKARVIADPIPDTMMDRAEKARDSCPVSVIDLIH